MTGLLCHGTLAHPTEDMTRYATPVAGPRGEVVVPVSIEEEPHLTGIAAGAVFPVHATTVAGTVFPDNAASADGGEGDCFGATAAEIADYGGADGAGANRSAAMAADQRCQYSCNVLHGEHMTR